MSLKKVTGKVISDKMQKTAVISVDSFRHHPVYEKRYRTTKKYLADNTLGAVCGNLVVIQECRPVSRRKSWVIVEIKEN